MLTDSHQLIFIGLIFNCKALTYQTDSIIEVKLATSAIANIEQLVNLRCVNGLNLYSQQ